MTDIACFSILAPVPLAHLRSGVEISNNSFVAFGSNNRKFFRKVDEKRGDRRVPVLFYPSHVGMPAKDRIFVSWVGWYVGSVDSKNGVHPKGMKHRPSSTDQDSPDFVLFWHVNELRELPDGQHLPISNIKKLKGGLRKDAPPRRPDLVVTPSSLERLL